jgi:hypothetical protein
MGVLLKLGVAAVPAAAPAPAPVPVPVPVPVLALGAVAALAWLFCVTAATSCLSRAVSLHCSASTCCSCLEIQRRKRGAKERSEVKRVPNNTPKPDVPRTPYEWHTCAPCEWRQGSTAAALCRALPTCGSAPGVARPTPNIGAVLCHNTLNTVQSEAGTTRGRKPNNQRVLCCRCESLVCCHITQVRLDHNQMTQARSHPKRAHMT